jgi:hypothetical protein
MRVVKIGGRAQANPQLPTILRGLWCAAPGALCIVHGGGDEMSAMQRALGREPAFVGGRRVTSEGDLELLRMVLSGVVNKRLVNTLLAAGVPAIGISGEDGRLIGAETIDAMTLGFAGRPVSVNSDLLRSLLSAGHMPVDVRELGCDFLAFSGHKMCGPTGIGVLYGRAEILDSLPPYHGGGEMIVSVALEKSTFKKAPHRFEAGTPNIAGAIGLAAAIDYLEGIGRSAIDEHDTRLTNYAVERFAELPGMRILGPAGQRGAILGFVMDNVHPHDLTTFADQRGLALRGGHHCNQPLMRRFGLPGTTRASFYFYNTTDEIDRMIGILRDAVRFFA